MDTKSDNSRLPQVVHRCSVLVGALGEGFGRIILMACVSTSLYKVSIMYQLNCTVTGWLGKDGGLAVTVPCQEVTILDGILTEVRTKGLQEPEPTVLWPRTWFFREGETSVKEWSTFAPDHGCWNFLQLHNRYENATANTNQQKVQEPGGGTLSGHDARVDLFLHHYSEMSC